MMVNLLSNIITDLVGVLVVPMSIKIVSKLRDSSEIKGRMKEVKLQLFTSGLLGGNEPLYDPEILERLDFSRCATKFKPPISAKDPGEGLLVRPLCPNDYDRGFLQLLGQLTKVGVVSRKQFLEQFAEMKACPNTYYVTVVVDKLTNQVIGASTLVIEKKFIHGCAIRGRLEDVVVNDTYRGKQLGKLIITTVTLLAAELNCYKMTLDCKDKLVAFYTSLGYVAEPGNSNSMSIRFDASVDS